MKKLISSILLLLMTASAVFVFAFTEDRVNSQPLSEIQQSVNFQQHFDDLGITGSVIIYDRNLNRFYQHNPQGNDTAFLPASTYKIPNSLIALETGIISSDVDVLTWDGIERGFSDSPYPQWNQDLNLRLAFKYSAIWFDRVLARRIGHQRMQDYVSKIQYGNENIGAAKDIDRF